MGDDIGRGLPRHPLFYRRVWMPAGLAAWWCVIVEDAGCRLLIAWSCWIRRILLERCDKRVVGLIYTLVHSQRCAGRSCCVAVLRSFGLVSSLVRPAARAFPLRGVTPLLEGRLSVGCGWWLKSWFGPWGQSRSCEGSRERLLQFTFPLCAPHHSRAKGGAKAPLPTGALQVLVLAVRGRPCVRPFLRWSSHVSA